MPTPFELLQKEIESMLPQSPLDFELPHARRVLQWVLKLKPDADEALQIAALAHDMERAITGITEKDLQDYTKINEFKKEHAARSAHYITQILTQHHYPLETIEKVRHLVENHECGGDAETNILMDADSLAYFDYNIPSYLKRNGRERAQEKIKFMYSRLSAEAKKLVWQIPFDDQAIAQLVKNAISEL